MPRFYSNARRLAFASAVVVLAVACSDSPVETRPTIGSLSFNIVSGDGQSALANTELADPLVVQVVNERGRAVRDQIVNFRVVAGGGSVFAGTSLTNADGIAKEWWTLGASGAQSVEVRAVNPATGEKQVFATFNATITVPPPPSITPDGFEPNDFQGSRIIGSMVNGDSRIIFANFHTLTDVDWFRYTVVDGINPGCSTLSFSEDFTFTTTLTSVPVGSTYRVSLYWGASFIASRDVVGGNTGMFTYSYSGSCGSNDDRTLDLKVERLVGDPSATLYSLTTSVTEQ
jgi:hypothetical protein